LLPRGIALKKYIEHSFCSICLDSIPANPCDSALSWYNICMDKYKHYRTCVCNINYHIVWCVKYRNKVLTPEISEVLKDMLICIGEESGFDVIECETGESDHVHCFVTAPPKLSITYIVKHLKGTSAIRLFKKFPGLRRTLRKGHIWSSSFFVETIGSTSEENVRRYIERQNTRG